MRAVWYPTTVASNSFACKQLISESLNNTSDESDESINFKLHDFGARGVSSSESAGIGGAAHLVNFMGSDTLEGIRVANQYYDEDMSGFSIPASEHSTITSWGKDNESSAYENLLNTFGGDNKVFACVSDSYDIENAVTNIWGHELKDKVINSGGTVVIRPDSGNPFTVVPDVIERLMNCFGYETNSKGYRVLPPYVRVIQGDGINRDSIYKILQILTEKKISTDNIAFGMGGALLQQLNRDTFSFAMKCSAIKINGEWQDVYKDPKHSDGFSKSSKKGILGISNNKTTRASECQDNELELVYKNGALYRDQSFQEIRNLANENLEIYS